MKTKIILSLLLISSLFLNFKKCNKTKDTVIEYEYIKGETDTTITHILDSIKNIKPKKEVVVIKKFIKDTVFLKDTVLFFNDTLALNQFKTNYSDSLIDVEIKSNVKGILFSNDLKYNIKHLSIKSTDTIIKTVIENKNKFYLGAFTDGKSISPSVIFDYKSKYLFKASYNINNNYPYLGAYIKIK